jgi:hypothetical protein
MDGFTHTDLESFPGVKLRHGVLGDAARVVLSQRGPGPHDAAPFEYGPAAREMRENTAATVVLYV